MVSCDRSGCLVKSEVGGVDDSGGVWWAVLVGLGGVAGNDVGVVTLGDWSLARLGDTLGL